jgi:hypothetical protein
MGWLVLGVILGALYVWIWAIVFVGGEADDRAMREWDRQQRAFMDWFE